MNHALCASNTARDSLFISRKISLSKNLGVRTAVATAVTLALFAFGTHIHAANTGGVAFTDSTGTASYGNTSETRGGNIYIDTGFDGNVYGSYVYDLIADNPVVLSENTVRVSGPITIKYIYGSHAYLASSAASASTSGGTSGNTVTVSSNSSSEVISLSRVAGSHAFAYGANSIATANNNKVTSFNTNVLGRDSGHYGGVADARTITEKTTNSVANSNSLTISGTSTINEGDVYGGKALAQGLNGDNFASSATATASNNMVSFSDFSLRGTRIAALYGGHASTDFANSHESKALANKLEISNSVFSASFIVASYTDRTQIRGTTQDANTAQSIAKANASSVIVSDNSSIVGNIWAGYARASVAENQITEANDNSVVVTNNSTVSGMITGGRAYPYGPLNTSTVSANNNSVVVSNQSRVTDTIYGGRAQVKSSNGLTTVSGNTVSVSGGSLVGSGSIYGGFSYGVNKETVVSNNTVVVTGLGTRAEASLRGGASDSRERLAALSPKNLIKGNTVIVSNGAEVEGTIAGGYIYNSGIYSAIKETVSENTVIIDSATVRSSEIHGGVVLRDSEITENDVITVTNNTVTLTGNYILNAPVLFGGNAPSYRPSSNVDLFTGNVLNLDARLMEDSTLVGTVANFETINIQAPNISNGAHILITEYTTLGDGLDRGTAVNLISVGADSRLNKDDEIVLIANAGGDLSNNEEKQFVRKGNSVVLGYEATIKLVDRNVVAVFEGETINVTPETLETKVVNENRVATVALINGGTNLLSDMDIREKPIFGVIRGGHTRYKTGSHANLDGINLITGATHTFKGQNADFTGGIFFEAGYGDIGTENSIGRKALKGDGDSKYYGGGLLARYDLTEGTLKGSYARVALRAGRLFSDYTNKDALSGLKFSLNSNYYAGFVGIGHLRELTPAIQMDLRAQYMFSQVKGKDVRIGEDLYRFKDTDSHRTHLALELSYTANPCINPFVSFAWEHEFDGKAHTSISSYTIDKASLTGSTGIVKAGLTMRPSKESNFSLDAGVAGYFGTQKGVNGEIRMQYRF